MAPLIESFMSRSIFQPGLASQQFRLQWSHPKDVFSVLLILGGDIVGRALAQLAGGWLTPVTFSFGACLLLAISPFFSVMLPC